MYAIKSHLTSLLSSRSHSTLVIGQLSTDMLRAYITCGTSKVTMAITHTPWYNLKVT